MNLDSSIVDEIWGIYGTQITVACKVWTVARFGAISSSEHMRKRTVEILEPHIDTGVELVHRDIPITRESLSEFARVKTTERSGFLKPTIDALVLSFAHSCFEQLVISLCEAVVTGGNLDELVDLFPERKVPARLAVEDILSALRIEVMRELRMSYSLFRRVSWLRDVAAKRSGDAVLKISKLYGLKDEELKTIDKRRQDIVHKVIIEDNYDVTRDLLFLELFGCYLVHLVSVSLLNKDLRYASIPAMISGDIPAVYTSHTDSIVESTIRTLSSFDDNDTGPDWPVNFRFPLNRKSEFSSASEYLNEVAPNLTEFND